MSVSVVVDASALLALVLPDTKENKAYAIELTYAAEAGRVQLTVPQLAHHEIAAKLIRRVRDRTVSKSRVSDFMESITDIPIQTELDCRGVRELFQDAFNFGCGGYDAVYVRAAVDNSAMLATLDKKLTVHMANAGVQRWQP